MADQITPLQKSLDELQDRMEKCLEILNNDGIIPEMKVPLMRELVNKIFDCEVQLASVMLRD